MMVPITGGSIYIGASTVRRLAEDGAAVVVVDLATPTAPLTCIGTFVPAIYATRPSSIGHGAAKMVRCVPKYGRRDIVETASWSHSTHRDA